MRRLLAFTLLAAVFVVGTMAASASASAATYNGKFTSGSGLYNKETVTLAASGTWSVAVGKEGAQITGVLFATHAPCADSLPPCQFNLPLTAVAWDEGTWSKKGVLTQVGTFGGPVTSFVFTFTLNPAHDKVALHVDITGCPFGWTYWDFTGDLSP